MTHFGAAPSNVPVIELRDVVREYAGAPPVRALDHVNLRIARGEFVAIVGPSGSGKSTLMNLIALLDRPSVGNVLVGGVETSQRSDRELAGIRAHHIGMIFQEFHLLDELSAIDNVALSLLYRGVDPATRRQRAAAVLDRVGLGNRSSHHPRALSGGERQRVAIARAVIGEPDIVLADEPTGNLDSASGEGIVRLLSDLNDAGTTIAVVTHDRELARRLARQIHVHDGHVGESAPVATPRGDATVRLTS